VRLGCSLICFFAPREYRDVSILAVRNFRYIKHIYGGVAVDGTVVDSLAVMCGSCTVQATKKKRGLNLIMSGG
jgi:hypothetical protein